MPNIQHQAEECNVIPTATTNNTASTKSAFEQSIPGSSGEENKDKIHGFSKKMAELKNVKGEALGDNAAIILRYLLPIRIKAG